MRTFCIRGENYHWIDNDRENRTDLCVHGHVTVTIGETEREAEGTVSAAALLLLKSLTEDHIPDWAILHQLFRQKYEDPRMYGFLTDIFLHTYCSTCRHTAVKILAEHGMLQEAVRQRCLWDCEPETRKLAVEMEGKTI